jgi:hypothetical protein
MNDLLTIRTQGDITLQEVFKGRPYLTNIEGSINICMTLCGQDIDGCGEVEFINMKNYEKILVCNPNPNQKSTCNIQLAFDSTSDNINDEGIGKYTFEKMFLTVPSMHKLNGQIYDVEVYLLYSSTQKNGDKLYVCMCSFFQGTNSISNQDWKLVSYKLMNELFSKPSKIPNKGQTLPVSAPPNPVDVNDFLPIEGFRNFYEYTHPSNTKVNFRIFQTPLLISNVALKNLRDKLTPGVLYNNMRQMIQSYKNPPDGVFIFFSQDFTKSIDSALQGQLSNPSLKSCPPQKISKKVKKTGKQIEKSAKKTGKQIKKLTKTGGKKKKKSTSNKKKKEKFTSEHFQNESDDDSEEQTFEEFEDETQSLEDDDSESQNVEEFEGEDDESQSSETENIEEFEEFEDDDDENETQSLENDDENNETYKNKPKKKCASRKSAPLDEMSKTKHVKTYTIFALIFMVVAPLLLFVSISKILNDPSFEGLGNYLPDENKILSLLNNESFRTLISQKIRFYLVICIQIILTIITSLFIIVSKNNEKNTFTGMISTIIIAEILAFVFIGFYTKQRINIGLSNYDVSELDYSIFSMKLGLKELLSPSTPISVKTFSQLNFNTNQQFPVSIQKGGDNSVNRINNGENVKTVESEVPPEGVKNINELIRNMTQEPMDNKLFLQDYASASLIYLLYYGWIVITTGMSIWLLVKIIELKTKFFSTSGIKLGLFITLIIAGIVGFIGIYQFNVSGYLPLSYIFPSSSLKKRTDGEEESNGFKPVSPQHSSRPVASFETDKEKGKESTTASSQHSPGGVGTLETVEGKEFTSPPPQHDAQRQTTTFTTEQPETFEPIKSIKHRNRKSQKFPSFDSSVLTGPRATSTKSLSILSQP